MHLHVLLVAASMLRLGRALLPSRLPRRLPRHLGAAAAADEPAPPRTVLDASWAPRLDALRRPVAVALADQLAANALGFPHASLDDDAAPARGPRTLLLEALDWKATHATKVVLVRVGEFYEAWGVDAVMLVEHCGLNAMGDKVRAGCPWRNLQATLDGLTAVGLSVAVYEERPDGDRKKRKVRYLSQVVTPASRTYVSGSNLERGDIDFGGVAPKFFGVATETAAGGHALVSLDVDARLATVRRGVTPGGCRAAVFCDGGAAAPAFFFEGADTEGASRAMERNLRNHASKLAASLLELGHPAALPAGPQGTPRAVASPAAATDGDLARALALAVAADVLCLEDPGAFADDVRVRRPDAAAPRPLSVATAAELGLGETDAGLVPALVPALLPRVPRASSARFLKRWLLAPPPEAAAAAMRRLVEAFAACDDPPPLAGAPYVPRQKLVRLLADREANRRLFLDVAAAAGATAATLRESGPEVTAPLLVLLEAEAGAESLNAEDALEAACDRLRDAILDVVEADAAADPGTSDSRVPAAFFERNEAPFRGVVKRAVLPDAYGALDAAAAELAAAVAEDFPPAADVAYDVVNNGLSFKPAAGDGDGFVAPLDRHRRPQHHKRTSPRVEAALGAYVAAAEACAAAAAAELRALAGAVYGGHVDAALAATALAQVCGAAFDHAQSSLEKSWGSAAVGPDLALRNVSPFWLPRDAAAGNDVALESGDVAFLTGPNAAGKSTLLRSLGAAALLSACGLRAPVDGGTAPPLDGLVLRSPRGDAPVFGKSAFAVEMDDLAQLLDECTARSLVLVDELGRGTSAREGAAVGAAVLCEFRERRYTGVFATHLHEILDVLGDDAPATLKPWRMGAGGDGGAAFRVEAGVCTDSRALEAAARAGVPAGLVARAAAFLGRDAPVAEGAADPLAAAEAALGAGGPVLVVKRDRPPPPKLAARSCVYAFAASDVSGAPAVYVGETDALRGRLARHDATYGDRSPALVVALGDKSASRKLEAAVIRRLRRGGVPLLSTDDGAHVAFGGAA